MDKAAADCGNILTQIEEFLQQYSSTAQSKQAISVLVILSHPESIKQNCDRTETLMSQIN